MFKKSNFVKKTEKASCCLDIGRIKMACVFRGGSRQSLIDLAVTVTTGIPCVSLRITLWLMPCIPKSLHCNTKSNEITWIQSVIDWKCQRRGAISLITCRISKKCGLSDFFLHCIYLAHNAFHHAAWWYHNVRCEVSVVNIIFLLWVPISRWWMPVSLLSTGQIQMYVSLLLVVVHQIRSHRSLKH